MKRPFIRQKIIPAIRVIKIGKCGKKPMLVSDGFDPPKDQMAEATKLIEELRFPHRID